MILLQYFSLNYTTTSNSLFACVSIVVKYTSLVNDQNYVYTSTRISYTFSTLLLPLARVDVTDKKYRRNNWIIQRVVHSIIQSRGFFFFFLLFFKPQCGRQTKHMTVVERTRRERAIALTAVCCFRWTTTSTTVYSRFVSRGRPPVYFSNTRIRHNCPTINFITYLFGLTGVL